MNQERQKAGLPVEPKSIALLFATILMFSHNVFAAESAYEDLDACTKAKQGKQTAIGAFAGGVVGAIVAKISGKNIAAGALAGAGIGGVAGFTHAYYSAVESCYAENPDWIPESKLSRTNSYHKVKREMNYHPEEGVVVLVKSLKMPYRIKGGESIDITATYHVMTPDGAEIPIIISRKLFVVENGEETEVPFPANAEEERVVEPGAYTEVVSLKTPGELKADTVLKVVVGVRTENDEAPVSQKSKKFRIL